MKKCAFILGLLLLSGTMAFARCCDCCDDCDYYYYSPRGYRVMGSSTRYIVNYPPRGINVSFQNRYRPGHNPRMRGPHHPMHGSGFGASVRISI